MARLFFRENRDYSGIFIYSSFSRMGFSLAFREIAKMCRFLRLRGACSILLFIGDLWSLMEPLPGMAKRECLPVF
jgi:hypothetical protein